MPDSLDDDVGGAIGMYPNGLAVIRDVSPTLLQKIRDGGKPFVYRRWMRHDGATVAVGDEKCVCFITYIILCSSQVPCSW